MNDMHGIIFAYSSNTHLKELTEHRTASSIPYGGRYRVIDFMLSNLVNAGVRDVGVIMRENYQSLLDHLGSGKDWDLSRKRGGLRLLPPFGYAGGHRDSLFRGRMDALASVLSYIERIKQDHIVMADGDIVITAPLQDVFEAHIKSGADITCICSHNKMEESQSEAFYKLGDNNRIIDITTGDNGDGLLQSLNIYILSKKLVISLINHCIAHNLYHLNRDVLLAFKDKLHISAYIFDGYCAKLTSVSAYFRHSLDLLRSDVRRQLFIRSNQHGVYTKVRDEASTYYGPESTVKNAVVADGCYIEGSIENCILFRGVRVDPGAAVQNCILMQDTHVKRGAKLSYAITDKEVIINEGHMLTGHESYPIAISKGTAV